MKITLHGLSHYPPPYRAALTTIFANTLARGCGGEWSLQTIDTASHRYLKAKRDAAYELERLDLITPEETDKLYPIVSFK